MRKIFGASLLIAVFWLQAAFAAPAPKSQPGKMHIGVVTSGATASKPSGTEAVVTQAVVTAATGTGNGQKKVEDVIPLTMGNLRGHKMLYNEGWFVITSSKKSLAYAKEHMYYSSGEALTEATEDVKKDSAKYAAAVKENVTDAVSTGADITSKGTKLTGDILSGTHAMAKKELSYAGETFGKAMDQFVIGTVGIGKRTERERRELAAVPGGWYKNLKSDFSNIHELTEKAREKFGGKIDAGWDKAFNRASREFRAEYERSGESQNTLTALGPVLFGWLKAFYHGIAAPTSKSVVKGTATGASYAFLPVAATSVVAGRTVQAVGLTVYYTGESVVKIISPTVEGGLLASLSLVSTAAVPATYAGGAALGAVNQVAFTAAGPAYMAGVGGGAAVVDTAGYVAFVAYDAGAGVTKVAINQASSGVVLGYNALTALPTHVLLGAGDAAIFLAWDGPRLVIASAKGEVRSKDGAAKVSDLPVGSVVDLKKLKDAGVQVDVLTTDEQTIKGVIEKLPNDLREDEHGQKKTE